MTTKLTIDIEHSLSQRLSQLANDKQCSEAQIAAQAIEDYVNLNEWQVNEINQALTEADNGQFATTNEVSEIINKYAD